MHFRWKSRHRICCLQKAEKWRLYSFYHRKTPPPYGKSSPKSENRGSHSTCLPREIQPELKMELTRKRASLKTLDTFFFSGKAEDHGPGLPCVASGSFFDDGSAEKQLPTQTKQSRSSLKELILLPERSPDWRMVFQTHCVVWISRPCPLKTTQSAFLSGYSAELIDGSSFPSGFVLISLHLIHRKLISKDPGMLSRGPMTPELCSVCGLILTSIESFLWNGSQK